MSDALRVRAPQAAYGYRPGMVSRMPTHPTRIARTLLGFVLLLRPKWILAVVGERTPPRRWVLLARILGVRHLAEAVVVNARPLPALAALGAAVDAIHGCTAAACGFLDRPRRRLCWSNSALAAVFALAGARHARALRARDTSICPSSI
jgi:hypothetical protein